MHRRFGISTHLFHDQRLTREHLVRIAAHGFDAVEVFATRTHFDYRDQGAVGALAEWLAEAGLDLHSMHAPIWEGLRGGQPVGAFSTAAADPATRALAVEEARAALQVASRLPYRFLVLHLGVPSGGTGPTGDNVADAARRSVEEIADTARGLRVQLALEVIPNALSSATSLVQLLEGDLEDVDVGVCLDYGHAHLMGDLGDAIEALSGHLRTTHVHDNGERADEHLVPFAGTIDWDTAMMQTQKIGYDDVLLFEVAGGPDPLATLQRASAARTRLEQLLEWPVAGL